MAGSRTAVPRQRDPYLLEAGETRTSERHGGDIDEPQRRRSIRATLRRRGSEDERPAGDERDYTHVGSLPGRGRVCRVERGTAI
jgi:hypothetical protein